MLEQEWFSVRDFAKLAGVHYNTVRNCIAGGKIHAVDHGTKGKKFWRIHRREIERMGLFSLKELISKEAEKLVLNK